MNEIFFSLLSFFGRVLVPSFLFLAALSCFLTFVVVKALKAM